MSRIDKSRNMYPILLTYSNHKSLAIYISFICNITNLTPHTLVTCGVTRYQPSGIHVTNLSNVLFFSEKNKVFKKKNRTFSLKEQELFKI